MDNREIILQVECVESKGKITRSVRLAELSFDKLGFFWERTKGFDVLFNDFTRGDFKAFVNHFVVQINGEPSPTGLIWEIDDVGLFTLNNIKPCDSAQVHFVFWDKKLRGRESLCRKMLEYVFSEYHFRRITAEIPLYAHFAMMAADRIGFVHEGRRRKAIIYKETWYDMNEYSILPEDLKEEHNPNSQNLISKKVCIKCGEIYKKNRIYKPKEANV